MASSNYPLPLLIFDLRASLAHFRRPDTTSTHASYPFITRTALRGLLGAIMGVETWPEDAWTGLQLLRPVATRVQQLSMLGKGFLESGPSFNRPTAIELVIHPHYRIFYTGCWMEELTDRIRNHQAVFPTYLGSAFAPVVPDFVDLVDGEAMATAPNMDIECHTVIPTDWVAAIAPEPGHAFGRVGGLLYRALPHRRFAGTMNLLYEEHNRPFRVTLGPPPTDHPLVLARLPKGSGSVALW